MTACWDGLVLDDGLKNTLFIKINDSGMNTLYDLLHGTANLGVKIIVLRKGD